jgi:hypothetical protein
MDDEGEIAPTRDAVSSRFAVLDWPVEREEVAFLPGDFPGVLRGDALGDDL